MLAELVAIVSFGAINMLPTVLRTEGTVLSMQRLVCLPWASTSYGSANLC